MRNPFLHPMCAAILAVADWVSIHACGSPGSYEVYDSTYLNATGVKDNSPFKLVALASADSSGSTYVTVGANQTDCALPVRTVRVSITVDDQRTGKKDVVLDYPFSKIVWELQDDAAPSITFTRAQNNQWLYDMDDHKESLWTRNDDNYDKNCSIHKYDRAPQELFNTFTLKAKITLPRAVYDQQVKPLLFRPVKAR